MLKYIKKLLLIIFVVFWVQQQLRNNFVKERASLDQPLKEPTALQIDFLSEDEKKRIKHKTKKKL